MSKQAPPELGTFVDQHPTTAVADLLGIINDSATLEGACNRDVITATCCGWPIAKVSRNRSVPWRASSTTNGTLKW